MCELYYSWARVKEKDKRNEITRASSHSVKWSETPCVSGTKSKDFTFNLCLAKDGLLRGDASSHKMKERGMVGEIWTWASETDRTGLESFNLSKQGCSCGLVTESCLTVCNPWTVAHQAPLSMGLPRQEYWNGLPFLSPPNQITSQRITFHI